MEAETTPSSLSLSLFTLAAHTAGDRAGLAGSLNAIRSSATP